MATKPHSAALVCSESDRGLVDRLSCALGYAPYGDTEPADATMVVPLSTDGASPARWYAAHSRADDQFAQLFEAGAAGMVPTHPRPGHAWADYGLSRDDVAQLLSRLAVRIVRNARGAPAYAQLIDELSLQRIDSAADQET